MELYSAQNNNSPYGVEFSAENRKAYATVSAGAGGGGASQVLQWDLESVDIPNSIQVIHSSNTISAGALQLGIDRRIYRAQVSFQNFNNSGRYLGVINNPEADGMATNYNEQGVLVDINGFSQNLSRIGLPPFIQSLFNSETDIIRNGISTTELKLCTNDSYTLQAEDITGADYVWSFEGNPISETSAQLFVDTPGFYEVYLNAKLECVMRRDVKGLYSKAKNNELSNLIGFPNGPVYEIPDDPDFVVNSGEDDPKDSISFLYGFIESKLKT